MHPSQEGWTEQKYYQLHPTSIGNISVQTNSKISAKLECQTKFDQVRIFVRIQSKDSDSVRFEKLDLCAALLTILWE